MAGLLEGPAMTDAGDGPETRRSLVLRLADHRDGEAWREFLAIYEPMIYRLVRSRGVQHADAEELTQKSLVAVAGAIGRWDPDPAKGAFRGWLFRIARNMLLNYLARTRPGDRGTGGTDFHELLAQKPAPSPAEETLFEEEYRRAVFAWAAEEVRGTVREASWRAFWRTAVDGRPAEEVAAEFGLTIGAVYALRSRIMAKLKRKVEEWEAGAGPGREARP